MSSVRSATSPATISQSSGEDGYNDSVTGLFPVCPVCRSLIAHRVGRLRLGRSWVDTTLQPNEFARVPVTPMPPDAKLEQVLTATCTLNARRKKGMGCSPGCGCSQHWAPC